MKAFRMKTLRARPIRTTKEWEMRMLVVVAVFGLALAVAPPADGVPLAGAPQAGAPPAAGGPVSAAVRTQTGGGELGPDYVRADAADLGAGSYRGATPVPSATPATAPVYRWERAATGARCVVVTDAR